MIISERHTFVYVATPKTGSRTMYAWLKKHYGGVQHGDHNSLVPLHLRRQGYYIFTTVRNPYTRALSAWWSTTMQEGDRYHYRQALMDWCGACTVADFLRWLIKGMPRLTSSPHEANLVSQTSFLQGAVFNKVLKMEELPEQAYALPFCGLMVNPMLKLNPSVGRPPDSELLTPEVMGLVERWAPLDFATFGYVQGRV